MSSARGAFAASLVSRVPPAGEEGARPSTHAGGSRTGAYRRLRTAMVDQGKGKGDEGGTRCERRNAPRPATPSMLIAS
eukprot:2829915-Pleurochrysis_carterae.AAC.1